MDSFNDYLT